MWGCEPIDSIPTASGLGSVDLGGDAVTFVGEAAAGIVLEALLARLRGVFTGMDAQLRRLVPEALAAAAEQTGLSNQYDGRWVARKILEDAAAAGVSRLEVVGTAPGGIADLEPAAISNRLRAVLRSELSEDLASVGVELDRVVDRFGPCLVDAVRARAISPNSPLRGFASRLEADASYALLDNVAAAVGASREDVSTILDTMTHEAERRILKRLDILGVANGALAAEIIGSLELVPLPKRDYGRLFAFVGEGGSGKTTLAERAHLGAIDAARNDRQLPLPLFVEATSLGSITAEISRVWAAASDLTTRGVDVVVDGLDEVGVGTGQTLVSELRSLVNDSRSPIRRALVTARPLDFGLRDEETIRVPSLSHEQALTLVAMVTERPTFPITTTTPLAEAVRRPFFAIAAGVALSDDSGLAYATPSRILERIALRAVGDVAPHAMELLARVAAVSVDRHHGYMAMSSVARNFAERDILRTNRLVEVDRTGQKIRFPVGLIAEWFAAEYLLNNPEFVTQLIANGERLELWRYPLLLAIESRDESTNAALLRTLATRAPAMSGWLLSQTDPFQAATLGSPNGVCVHRDQDEYTREFVTAYDALGKGIAPGSSRLAIFERGRPNPVWLRTAPASITYSWAANHLDDPDVIPEPPDRATDPLGRWIRHCSSAMSDHPAWTWRHAHDELRRDFAAVRKSGQVFEGLPIYERERRWSVALDALGLRGSRNPGTIPLETLQSRIAIWEQVAASTGQAIPDGPQIATLREIVQELREEGVDRFEGPWPMPDNLGSGIGWVWALWSDAASLERLQRVTEAALELYVASVDREIPRLAPALSTRRQVAGRFVGFRQSNKDTNSRSMVAPVAWTFVPGPPGVSWEIVADPYAAATELGNAHSGLRIRYGEPHGLYGHRPATLFAMELLEADLQQWGWGMHGNLPGT